ncbi:hypothetical protein KC19_2G106000 [Ceratodon purpureus]|uniref:Protein kinase domain-containing protein n=1 Tax=Ceratodon purpureus TaxID=3225 RepID=A0A8T0ISE2_CERPU|nr:hypothetical protein KC19_2G106000 [Ceratodon purpureus]
MGAETFHSARTPAPSRISNSGEMVDESVLQQTLEEEQVLEDVVAEGRLQSPGGRKLLVAMKLNAPYCQEILERTLTELAMPGDRILAFHVASCPGSHSVASSCEHEEYFEQLADSLGGLLDVYEELCNLRQIKLEIEIIPGVDVKKVLVDFARSHDTCTLILGSHKHFTVRRNKSLGRYCLRRLPFTCTVVVLERGEIILNDQGTLRTSTGAGMIKTLRRSLRSFGRSSKKAMKVGSNEGPDDPPRPSDAAHLELCRSEHGFEFPVHSTEIGKCYFSDSSPFQGFRHSFQGFSHSSVTSSPKADIRRADMFILEDQNGTQPVLPVESHVEDGYSSSDSDGELETPRLSESILDFKPEDLVIPGWPLMHHLIGFDTERHSLSPQGRPSSIEEPSAPSPLHPLAIEKKPASRKLRSLFLEEEKSAEDLQESRSPDKVKSARNHLHRMFSLTKKFPNQLDRQMSIIDWALKLPSRSKEAPKSPTSMTFAEEVYAKLLQEIALDAFRARGDHVEEETSSEASVEARSTDLNMVDEKEEFSLNVTKAGDVRQGSNAYLVERLDLLCSDRKCITFVYEELEAGTSNFSPSNVVGRGGGSEVFKGKLPGGRLVAVKRLNGGPQAVEELLNDVGINTSLLHPHIVPLLGYCVDSSHLILVYDYLPEGNLEDRLHAAGKEVPVLPWRERYKVAVGTAKALDYLHHGTSRPVIHRDVKSSNILLTSDFEAQLSDFGLAKWAPKKASYLLCNDILGTFGYLAPEYFMYGRVNNKTDVYAFGVVLLELITGRSPIDNTKPKGQENLVNWARPLLEEKNLEILVDSRLKGVYDVDQMKRMLLAASLCVQQSPRRRPQMSRVLQILCSSHGRLQSIRATSEENTCTDFSEEELEEGDIQIEESPTFGKRSRDIQTHLALALLGVDDDLISRSSLNHSGVDLPHHLDNRFSLSSRLVQ